MRSFFQRSREQPQVIVHITEAMSSGVLDVIGSLCRAQAARGADVEVYHSRRDITPSSEELDGLLGSRVERAEVYSGSRAITAMLVLAWTTIKVLICSPSSKIHVHSSKAGFVVRVVAAVLGCQDRIFYSPHGFAFLREDISPTMQKALQFIEAALARVGGSLILCSKSEQQVASEVLNAKRTVLLENAIDTSSLPLPESKGGRRLRVVTSGRVSPQKAPWRFGALAERFSNQADFIWVGDGDQQAKEEWLAGAGVTVTGWLSRPEVLEELVKSDIFVLLSAWEGMPIALIEAQCVGLPCIVTDVVGNRDVVLHELSGAVCSSQEDIHTWMSRLLDDAGVRQEMSHHAVQQRFRFDVTTMSKRSLSIYDELERPTISCVN